MLNDRGYSQIVLQSQQTEVSYPALVARKLFDVSFCTPKLLFARSIIIPASHPAEEIAHFQ